MNNAIEAFHSQYNAQFYAAHPNIYFFIDVLNTLQVNTYVKKKKKKNIFVQTSTCTETGQKQNDKNPRIVTISISVASRQSELCEVNQLEMPPLQQA